MRQRFNFDRQALSVLLLRSWNIVAGGITILLIPLQMTQTEQGFYYAFFSVLALQVFFDLGINFVVVQLVGHESALLSINAAGVVHGDPARVGRLQSLVVLLSKATGSGPNSESLENHQLARPANEDDGRGTGRRVRWWSFCV